MPTPSTVNASSSTVTVSWSQRFSPIVGQLTVGTVSVSIPSSATVGQSYTVLITAATASFQGASIPLQLGVSPLTVGDRTYLIGDIFPYTGDSFPNFGDGSLNTLDLIYALRAVTNIGVVPSSCTDRFDAIDSYPVDTTTQRGGDGLLNTLDLIETLRRVVYLDLSRPRRAPRGLCQMETQSVKPRVARSVSQAGAPGSADAALELDGDGSLYLHAFHDLGLVGVAVAVSSTVGDPITWQPEGGLVPTVLDQELKTVLAASWLQGLVVPNGNRLRLGRVLASHPNKLHVGGASANDRATGGGLNLTLTDPPGQ